MSYPPLPLVQVWISYAKFELSIDGPDRLQKCRQIFEEANKSMRSCEEKEERLMLLESWSDFEKEFGSDSTMERVRKLLPEKVKKRRKLTAEDGVRTGRQLTEGFITERCEVMSKITDNRKSKRIAVKLRVNNYFVTSFIDQVMNNFDTSFIRQKCLAVKFEGLLLFNR